MVQCLTALWSPQIHTSSVLLLSSIQPQKLEGWTVHGWYPEIGLGLGREELGVTRFREMVFEMK